MELGATAIPGESDKMRGQTDGDDTTMTDVQHPDAGSHHDTHPLSPTPIKQETITTPQTSSPTATHTGDGHLPKAVTTLKSETSMRLNSPLRESSVPVPSTEMATPDQPSTKKRPAPARSKKGTASKAPAAKKRKVEPKGAKSSVLKQSSAKGTPVNSSPASSPARSDSLGPDGGSEEEDEDFDAEIDDDNLYCLCRKPDTGTFMIGCDGTCDDWFHGKCVGIDDRNKNLIDRYMCPRCTQAGIGVTLWKRMCRRQGCRQPARVAKGKGGNGGSKYCSDDCGVLHFRNLASKTRNSEEWARSRSSRRKSEHTASTNSERDLGARGGLLSGSELKSLLQFSTTLDDFHALGQGVLSPPATPKEDQKDATNGDAYSADDLEALAKINGLKEQARTRHQLLKDRMKFITMAKQAATRMAAEKELKPKEYCGYDSRIEWTDEQFLTWRNSEAGKKAFETEALEEPPVANGSGGDATDSVCARKKCARHVEWGKLAVDDIRFEMADNSDKMRGYDREEQDVRRRATLRLGNGTNEDAGYAVELHEQQPQEPIATT